MRYHHAREGDITQARGSALSPADGAARHDVPEERWNANYRKVPLLLGLLHPEGQVAHPLNQQDNYLTITGFAAN